MDLSLKDQVVLITGGASGIGLAAAHGFAEEGAHVVLWDLSPETATQARTISIRHPVRSLGQQVDVTDLASVESSFRQAARELGPIDHLVHSAGIGSGHFGLPYTNVPPDAWARVLTVNVMGMTNVAHVVGPALAERGRGSMVFLSSVAGQIGSQTDPPYSASKAANINFAQCLAKDLAPRGVRVNTVCPGMVQTPLNRSVWQAWHAQASAEERLTYEEWADRKIRAVVPLGTWQPPEAVADMIVFLSSGRAAHVTGQTINVDGGFVMHW